MNPRSLRVRAVGLMVLVVLGLGFAGPSAGGSQPRFDTDRHRYRPREVVTTTLVNDSNETIRLTSEWSIGEVGGPTRARMYWGEPLTEVDPGETRVWRWRQDPNDCGQPQDACTHVGGYVDPGRYVVRAEVDGVELERRFEIGRYFTLGFERSAETFVVWAIEEKPIRQMTREARAEEKTLIVSGIVRGARRYNPDWSYTMGPRSIVLGEVFTEVCDGAPRYVERHRDEWRGERWCPWSSYVRRAGR